MDCVQGEGRAELPLFIGLVAEPCRQGLLVLLDSIWEEEGV